jgi:hypothetical protein
MSRTFIDVAPLCGRWTVSRESASVLPLDYATKADAIDSACVLASTLWKTTSTPTGVRVQSGESGEWRELLVWGQFERSLQDEPR